MTLVEGEELQRLWTLVSELSSQLSANQQLCQSLQAQADELKGHALHSGTGYTLRRFNTDISREKFESELEKVNASLVLENQTLAHDNKQMNLLLREYESTIEQIMSKFRSFSHSTQQHTLALTSHYETLLANNAYDQERAELQTNTAFSEHLTRLGGLVRLALREEEGEGIDDDDDDDEQEEERAQHPLETEGYRVGEPSGGVNAREGGAKKPQRKGVRTSDPRWYGTGGYTGSQGDPDAEVAHRALERMVEEEKLRKENEMLRDLLRISADVTPELAERLGIPMPIPVNAAAGWGAGLGGAGGTPGGASRLSLGKPRGSRKSLGSGEVSAGAVDVNLAREMDGQHGAVKTGFDDEDAAEDGDEHEEEEEDDDEEEEVEEEHGESREREDDFKPVDPPGPIEHVTQSAGGPLQLLHEGESSTTTASSGILVTADIADELDQGVNDADIEPIVPSSGLAPVESSSIASSTSQEEGNIDASERIQARSDLLADTKEKVNAAATSLLETESTNENDNADKDDD